MVICQKLYECVNLKPFLHAVSYEVAIQLESVLTSPRLHPMLFFSIEGVAVEAGVASGTVGKLTHRPS